MGYSILNNNSPAGKASYVADSTADLVVLKELNPPMGTSCLVLANSKVYVLNSKKEWISILNRSDDSGGGGGGDTPFNGVLRTTDAGIVITTADAYTVPLLELTVQGSSVQVGSPSAAIPIPIKTIASASLVISNENSSSTTTTPLSFTDFNNVVHKLHSLPNGKKDELIIDSDGAGTLYERTAEYIITEVGTMQTGTGNLKYAELTFDSPIETWESEDAMREETGTTDPILGFCTKCGHDREGIYIGKTWNTAYAYINGAATQADFNALVGATVVLRKPVTTYVISSIRMPSLPAATSIVQVAAKDENNETMTANITITYRRDVNAVINNLEQAIADIVG